MVGYRGMRWRSVDGINSFRARLAVSIDQVVSRQRPTYQPLFGTEIEGGRWETLLSNKRTERGGGDGCREQGVWKAVTAATDLATNSEAPKSTQAFPRRMVGCAGDRDHSVTFMSQPISVPQAPSRQSR